VDASGWDMAEWGGRFAATRLIRRAVCGRTRLSRLRPIDLSCCARLSGSPQSQRREPAAQEAPLRSRRRKRRGHLAWQLRRYYYVINARPRARLVRLRKWPSGCRVEAQAATRPSLSLLANHGCWQPILGATGQPAGLTACRPADAAVHTQTHARD